MTKNEIYEKIEEFKTLIVPELTTEELRERIVDIYEECLLNKNRLDNIEEIINSRY